MDTGNSTTSCVAFKPLGTWEKLSFGLSSFSTNLIINSIILFLLFYYTDVFGISAGTAGIIFLTGRIFDAVNDPLIGYFVDNTNTRWGKLRPYLLFGPIPLAVFFVLCFTGPDFSDTGKVIYAFIIFTVLMTLFGVVNIPNTAMAAVMTQDPHERSSLSAMSMIFVSLGAFFVSAFTQPIISQFSSQKQGFQAVSIIFAVIAVLLYWNCFLFVKERVHVADKGNKTTLRIALKSIYKNPPLMILCASFFFFMLMLNLRLGAVMYYFKYNVGQEQLAVFYLVMMSITNIVFSLLYLPIMKKIGKRSTFIIGAVVACLANLGVVIAPYSSIILIFIFSFFATAAAASMPLCAYSMLPDTVEYAEWKLGVRNEGFIFSAISFINKIAMALAGAISGFILSGTGYVANKTQETATLNGILGMMAVIPAVACAIACILIYFYKLDAFQFNKIVCEIAKRKSEEGSIHV